MTTFINLYIREGLDLGYLSIKQAADALGLNPEVVRRHIKRLGIPVTTSENDGRVRLIEDRYLYDLWLQPRRDGAEERTITFNLVTSQRAGKSRYYAKGTGREWTRTIKVKAHEEPLESAE
jgi:hypothetical protein